MALALAQRFEEQQRAAEAIKSLNLALYRERETLRQEAERAARQEAAAAAAELAPPPPTSPLPPPPPPAQKASPPPAQQPSSPPPAVQKATTMCNTMLDRGAIVRFAAANAAANASQAAARHAAERTGLRDGETAALRADAPVFHAHQPRQLCVPTRRATRMGMGSGATPNGTPPGTLQPRAADAPEDAPPASPLPLPPQSPPPQPPPSQPPAYSGTEYRPDFVRSEVSDAAALACHRTLLSAAHQSQYTAQAAADAWSQITWFGLQVFGFSPIDPLYSAPSGAEPTPVAQPCLYPGPGGEQRAQAGIMGRMYLEPAAHPSPTIR